MDLLDRYLAEVQRNLPRDDEPDIIDEIGDSIRSQIDEREASLGRPLTANEEADVLRAYGNPRVVATRYAKQQYLIGPQLLPFYWYTLRIVLTVVLALEVVGGAVSSLALGKITPFAASLDVAWHSVIYIFGIVTIVFALIERFGNETVVARFDRWDPLKLPTPGDGAPISRASTGFEFIANVTMLLVLLSVIRGPLAAFVAPFVLTDAWNPTFAALIVSCSVVALGALVTYIRPTLGKLHLLAQLTGHAIIIAGLGLSLRYSPLLTAKAGAVPADKLLAVNTMMTISFVIIMVAAGIAAAVTLLKFLRRANYTMSSASA